MTVQSFCLCFFLWPNITVVISISRSAREGHIFCLGLVGQVYVAHNPSHEQLNYCCRKVGITSRNNLTLLTHMAS